MNYTTRFDGKGDLYAKARPKYAPGLLEHMKNVMQIPAGSVFADVGSGTGIWTSQLLGCGYTVYAVEPNQDMRRKAEQKLAGNERFHSVVGVDSSTTLPDASVDYITAAQAFHWFNAEAFRQECRRILRPGGQVMLIYNSRVAEAECTRALAALYGEFNPGFNGFSNGISAEACCAFFDGNCTVLSWDNSLVYDRQGFIDRTLSSSYALKPEDSRFGAYLEAVNALFDRFARDGQICMPTNTVAYIG